MARMWQHLVKDSTVYGLGKVVSTGLNFALLPLFGLLLTPAEFGIYVLVTSASMVWAYAYSLGSTQALHRYYFEERDRRRLIGTVFSFQLLLGILFSALICISTAVISRILSVTTTAIVLEALTLFLINAVAATGYELLRLERRAGTYVAVTLLRVVVTVIATFVAISVFRIGLTGAFVARALGAACFAAVVLFSTHRHLSLGISRDQIRTILAFGLPFVPILAGFWGIDFVDRFLLATIGGGESSVGIYAMGYTIGQGVLLPIMAFHTAWPAILYRNAAIEDPGELARSLARVFTVFLLVSCSLALAVVALAEPALRLIAKPEYMPALGIIPWVVISYVAFGYYRVVQAGALIRERTLGQAVIVVSGLIVNIGANFVLIPRFGMSGAAAATVVTYLTLAVWTSVVSQRLYPIPMPWRQIIGILGSFCVALVATTIRWTGAPLNLRITIGIAALAFFVIVASRCAGLPLSMHKQLLAKS